MGEEAKLILKGDNEDSYVIIEQTEDGNYTFKDNDS